MSVCPHCAEPIAAPTYTAKFWFMFDCHLFRELNGTPEQMVETVVQGLRLPDTAPYWYSYGMLCPVRLAADSVVIREVGPHVHTRTRSEADIAKFIEDAQGWIAALKADPIICELLATPSAALTPHQGETR